MKLDLKDYKLLSELDSNSRQPIQQIAKKIGLSKDAINYRINKLMESGIIKSFNAVVNSGKLGYYGARLLIKFYHLSPQKEKEIIDYLLSNHHLKWMVSVEGKWDLNIWFLYKFIQELNQFYNDFLSLYRDFIEEKNFSLYSQIDYYSRDYLHHTQKRDKIIAYSLDKEEVVDSSDQLILGELTKNSRTTILELSRKAQVTPKTIIKKIRALENRKIITGYKTEFDLEKLGFQYYKVHLTLANSTSPQIKQLQGFLHQHPNFIYEDFVLGGYDLEFEMQFKDSKELRAFIDQIREKFFSIIRDYEILHYYKEYKLKFL
ncbi:MAG: Lrp/AsnC family transcriptional regulator [Candidatus Woesearchaeota archaeon]